MTKVDPQGARFRLGEAKGHYESWFLRGNHPTRPLAFWVRYTVTAMAGAPGDAVAELFAIVFDGERGEHVVAREAFPLTDALFPTSGLGVRIGAATLEPRRASGRATGPGDIAWDVRMEGGQDPLLLLPEGLYAGSFPKAKSLVMAPNVRFGGHFEVGGKVLEVDGWMGSTNHNWGERHTDRYAWGQVAGFADHPDSFIELASARVKIGPVLLPTMTPIVFRHRGVEHRLNALHTVFGRASIDGFLRGPRAGGPRHRVEWRFKAKGSGLSIAGTMHADAADFVTLWYKNPPGGKKLCINSKIATLDLEVKSAGGVERLRSPRGAAFEILAESAEASGVSGLPTAI